MAIEKRTINGETPFQVHIRSKNTEDTGLCPIWANEWDARQIEAQTVGSLLAGSVPFATICASYIQHLESQGFYSPRSLRFAKDVVCQLEAFLGPAMLEPAWKVTPSIVRAFLWSRLAQGLRPSAARRLLGTVRGLLKHGGMDLPISMRRILPNDRSQVHFVDAHNAQSILEYLPAPYRAMAELSELTFLRVREILGLERSRIDLPAGLIRLPAPNGGRARTMRRPCESTFSPS